MKKIIKFFIYFLIIIFLFYILSKIILKKINFNNSEAKVKERFENVEYNSNYIKNINNLELYNKEIKNKYKFVFISDLHLSNVDENEQDIQIKESLIERNKVFYSDDDSGIAKNTFKEIIKYTNNINANALLLGGDIIDSPADSSISVFKEYLSDLKSEYLYTFGNHDWSFAWDYHTENAKINNIPKFNDIMYDKDVSYLEYEDLIILAINSSTNQIEKDCLEKIKNVLDKKKPTIVMMHVPISTVEIANDSLKYRNRVSAVGEGGIEPNENTKNAFEMIFSEEYKVFYVLAGHVHIKMEADINNKIHEFITEPAYSGSVNVIKVN